tara:strand:- start:48122 stop:49324 length:1203 start_codon:yes stop_codon:yes gene_type:complete
MKITEKTYGFIVTFIYLSFALDSLLKINIGIKIHVGILLILLFNFIYFLTTSTKNKVKIYKSDVWLIIFGIYILINGIVKVGFSSLFIFFYFFLALNVYYFLSKNIKFIDEKVLYSFHILLISTGLLQFFLVLLFDYQLNFLGFEHYNKGSSVTLRLRGFFVEPNWFAIAFTFNTFLLFKNDAISFIKKHKILFLFTIIVFILNGSFGTLAVLIVTYGNKYLKKNVIIAVLLALLAFVGFYFIMQKRANFKKGKSGIELFNYYSRTEPFKRVLNYYEENPKVNIFFGNGFGSWGEKGVSNNLSVLNYKINPMSRDSSELHVFLFEIGLLGLFLFILDILTLYKNNLKSNFYIKGAIFLFIVSFLLYPIFKFYMYMVYYFLIRIYIRENKKDILKKKQING